MIKLEYVCALFFTAVFNVIGKPLINIFDGREKTNAFQMNGFAKLSVDGLNPFSLVYYCRQLTYIAEVSSKFLSCWNNNVFKYHQK